MGSSRSFHVFLLLVLEGWAAVPQAETGKQPPNRLLRKRTYSKKGFTISRSLFLDFSALKVRRLYPEQGKRGKFKKGVPSAVPLGILKLANHTGYIKIDWKLVERDVSKAKKHLKFSGSTSSKLAPEVKSQFDEAVNFLKRNVLLSGGFVGGFLLGMAS
ncbi:FUN14 domain-containing protein 1, partial [Ophiophagus hannah]